MGTGRMALRGVATHQTSWRQRGNTLIAFARRQAKKSKKAAQQPREAEAIDPESARVILDELEQVLPQAPPTSNRAPKPQEVAPEQIYPVFAPKPGTSTSAPWRWDDGGEDSRSQDESTSEPADDYARPWNPKTGFMPTKEEREALAAAEAAAASSGNGASISSSGIGGSTAGMRPPPVEVSLTVPPGDPLPAGADPDDPAALVMPASRKAVLTSAIGTGFWMTVLALVFCNFAGLYGPQALGTDPVAVAELLRWPGGLESLTDVGVAAGAAAAVTGARFALMSVWPELREATDRSNKQVLTSLGPLDILLVALVTGVPEELLFRGALVPASFPDWRGVLLAAAVFGALHRSGGRNVAFAVWAGGVGAVYGVAFLVTGNVWVPALAHTAANAASAFGWKERARMAAASGKAEGSAEGSRGKK